MTSVYEGLVREWLPIDVDPAEASPSARLIALALLAIAEQLSELRDDLTGGVR